MAPEPSITFGPFRLGLETPQARVWRGAQALTLRPRSLAVLRYLVEHPGRLVTKAELRQHVWAGLHVTDTVLRVCIRDIRAALDDAAAAPQYLETVGSQGYRWRVRGAATASPPGGGGTPGRAPARSRRPRGLVPARRHGRPSAGLRQWGSGDGQDDRAGSVARASCGGTARCGSPGASAWSTSGEGEPYLPVFAALGQLGHQPEGREFLAVLRQYAPLWLVHLPGLVSEPSANSCSARCRGRRRRGCCGSWSRRSTR